MWLRQRDWGVSARAQLHTPPLFRVLAWIGWFKVDDCGISRGNFQPTWHVQVTLRHLSCSRSFIAHKALYWYLSTTLNIAQLSSRLCHVLTTFGDICERASAGSISAISCPLPLVISIRFPISVGQTEGRRSKNGSVQSGRSYAHIRRCQSKKIDCFGASWPSNTL